MSIGLSLSISLNCIVLSTTWAALGEGETVGETGGTESELKGSDRDARLET